MNQNKNDLPRTWNIYFQCKWTILIKICKKSKLHNISCITKYMCL